VTERLKQRTLQVLRQSGLLPLAESVRFRLEAHRRRDGRAAFARTHGPILLPPDDVAYDAYGSLDWDFYWGFGVHIGDLLAPRIRALAPAGRLLEWGCGPARIIRHLPPRLGGGWEVHGSDANPRSIAWCTRALPGIHFAANGPEPPLPYPAAFFDCVYTVSVFTHLSEDQHDRWASELMRVIKPGGLLLCTLNGNGARGLLLPSEVADYDAGRLVVRGHVAGGTRCFVAWHPPAYVRDHLLRDLEILEHQPAPNPFGERQDLWIARRRG
jgi:SAM-dependent methyltransferase